jgi:hypothetical protein
VPYEGFWCYPPTPTASSREHRDATTVKLAKSLRVEVASLPDVIRSKEAAGREKDRAPLMRRTLREIRGREASERQRKT